MTTSADSLIAWKESVLTDVALHLTQTFGPKQPDALSIWKWDGRLPYPQPEQVQVLANGCMTLTFYANGLPVIISTWLMFGEIRIGIKLPATFARTPELQHTYTCLYDGTPSERKTLLSGALLIDWIFRDREFSRFDFMVRALCDNLASAVIADRVAQINLHLFIGLQDTLIEHHRCVIEATPRAATAFVHLDITGDVAPALAFLAELKADVASHTHTGDRGSIEAVVSPEYLDALHERVGHQLHTPGGELCTLDQVTRTDAPYPPGGHQS